MFTDICFEQLKTNILPFWTALTDERGGFFGRVDYQLNVDRNADKGAILNSRILWFFSSAAILLDDPEVTAYADHAYAYLRDVMLDRVNGGVYWSVTADGLPSDTIKHTYNQAFAIYALAAYYRLTNKAEALELANNIFQTIETKALCVNGISYNEAFTQDWLPAENSALSENGIDAKKTMNTVLHLIEAYTELYRVGKDEKVAKRLRYLLQIIVDYIYDAEHKALRVFFDDEMKPLGDIHSFGHDIEASWLLDRACEVLSDNEITPIIRSISNELSANIYNIAFERDSLNNERDGDSINKIRIWWVQAEAVIGFLNAYQYNGDERFLRASESVLDYICKYVVDKRCGEWFSELDYDGNPLPDREVAGPWKCPYHNGRMCIEVINRLAESK